MTGARPLEQRLLSFFNLRRCWVVIHHPDKEWAFSWLLSATGDITGIQAIPADLGGGEN